MAPTSVAGTPEAMAVLRSLPTVLLSRSAAYSRPTAGSITSSANLRSLRTSRRSRHRARPDSGRSTRLASASAPWTVRWRRRMAPSGPGPSLTVSRQTPGRISHIEPLPRRLQAPGDPSGVRLSANRRWSIRTHAFSSGQASTRCRGERPVGALPCGPLHSAQTAVDTDQPRALVRRSPRSTPRDRFDVGASPGTAPLARPLAGRLLACQAPVPV